MIDFLLDGFALLRRPCTAIYLDCKSAGIGGKAEIGSPDDYGNAFWKYYNDEELLKSHGEKAREYIITHYRWETVVDYFYNNVLLKI